MRDSLFRATCLLVGLALVPASAQSPQVAQPPRFGTAVDLVHLDVSVLDRNRRPVRGLAAGDFVVLEDGKPQAISTFTAVDMPDAVASTTAWMDRVAPDTRRNDTLDDRRLFVIVMDDGAAQQNMHARTAAKDAARAFIERLGPSDLAAVLFTMRNQHAQDYTSDKSRLLQAVERFEVGMRDMGGPVGPDTDDFYYRSSVDVLRRVSEALIALPQRRKTLVYIGQGVPVDPVAASEVTMIGGDDLSAAGNGGMQQVLLDRTMQVLAAAQRANVNIYTLDTCGLRVPPPPPAPAPPGAVRVPPTCVPGLEQEYLKDLAHATGGRAAVDSNDLGPAVEQIFVENGSYYLLGFASTNTRQDGRFRRLEVKVNRPGVEVRTRSGYTERDPVRDRRAAEQAADAPLAAAISGLLPKGDVPLQVWAAPFAAAGARTSDVAITLGIRQTLGARPLASTEQVQVSIDAFTPEGRRRTGKSANVAVALRPGPAGVVGYEIVSSLQLAPGRYQLRIGARLQSDGATGSIYYDLDVPDVSRNELALSGLALSVAPGVTSTRAEAMPWLPLRPTTARLFDRSDAVTVFTRVHYRAPAQSQGLLRRAGTTPSVPVRARLVDAGGVEVWSLTEALDPGRFTQGWVDLSLALPMATLAPGAHMLAIEARGVTQAVRFTVR